MNGIVERKIISLGLKNECAKILGCSEYMRVEKIALFVPLNKFFAKK